MATPRGAGRKWRFRLSDASTLEVSTPPPATEKQVRRRGRFSLILGTVIACGTLATIALGADLKADLSADSGIQQNKDLGSVVGGNSYPFDISIFYQGGPASLTSVTFDDDGSLPSFVSTVTGGTVTRSSGTGASTSATSAITVVAPCTTGSFGANDNSKQVGSSVQYAVTAVNSGASLSDIGASTAWVNIKGNVTSLGSNCTPPPPTDATPPVIIASVSGTLGNNGWYVSDVTVSWNVSDPESAISSSSGCGPTTINTDTAGTTLTCTATSAGGTSSESVTIMRDATVPTVSCNAAAFILNQPDAQVSATISDTLSGPLNATEYGAADTSSVGLKNVSITGYDNAGNSTTTSCSYTIGYNFDGLYDPVNKPNVLNVSKAGQAIPLKWRLTDYFGNPVTNLTSVGVSVTNINCNLGDTSDQVEEYAAGSSGLQNLGNGYYQFNWKTPTSYANSCKSLHLDLGEGAKRTNLALFSFKK